MPVFVALELGIWQLGLKMAGKQSVLSGVGGRGGKYATRSSGWTWGNAEADIRDNPGCPSDPTSI